MNYDTFLHVLDWADPDTLSSVCRLSREIKEIATPVLYRSIDLTLASNASDASDAEADPADLVIQKQQLFLQTLARHPEYSTLVRRFAWTAGLLRDVDEADLRDELPYVSPELHLFESLSSVNNVSITSDIPWVESNPKRNDAMAFAECDALFPAARSIEVAGRMNDTLARSMLSRKRRHSLQSLRIDSQPSSRDASDDEDEC